MDYILAERDREAPKQFGAFTYARICFDSLSNIDPKTWTISKNLKNAASR